MNRQTEDVEERMKLSQLREAIIDYLYMCSASRPHGRAEPGEKRCLYEWEESDIDS